MKLTVLVENTCADGLGCAHGLSLFIQTEKHKILFDAGPDARLLFSNAQLLDIDLAEADLAVLSHGHYDHAGGLMGFLERNSAAKLCVHSRALCGHYAAERCGFREIGVDPALQERFGHRLVLTDGLLRIDEELTLFSDIQTADLLSGANASLFEAQGGGHVPDSFSHEQNLLITQGEQCILVAGCAHRGIVNILRRAEQIAGRQPDHVFSGFHLTNPGLGLDEPPELISAVGQALLPLGGTYHTGHCTGQGPYRILREVLGSRIDYMSGGTSYCI